MEQVGAVSFPVKDAGRRAFHRIDKDTIELTASLYRPKGGGPFPAVVLMHGCTGLGAGSNGLENAALLLRDSGYVALVINSFSWRGVNTVCDDPLGKSPTSLERVEDALAARRYLSSLRFVDSRRIGLVGWSHGGTTALMTWARDSAAAGNDSFSAVAAFYPYCMSEAVGSVSAPLLILIGEKDDWCPADLCQRFVTDLTAPGRDISIAVFPGATHAFDSVDGGKAIEFQGHRLVADPVASQAARERLLGFFDRTLKKPESNADKPSIRK